MKLNNKGFALTSIVYMLIVLFLMLLLLILSNLAQRKVVLDKLKYDVKTELGQGGISSNEVYTVTFDPQGGELENNTKQVQLGKTYGELPVPTREGYTFKGWNGKNMINIDAAINESLIDNGDGTYTMWYNDKGRMSNSLNVIIQKNKNVIMSYDLIEYNGTYGSPLQIVCKPGNDYIIARNSIKTIAHDNSKLIIYQEGTQPKGTFTKFKNFQLEEGDTATPYEPYYVTSSVLVTQDKNHTLKAIWEENS